MKRHPFFCGLAIVTLFFLVLGLVYSQPICIGIAVAIGILLVAVAIVSVTNGVDD